MRAHFASDINIDDNVGEQQQQQQQQTTPKKDNNKQKQRTAKFACDDVAPEKTLEARIDDFKHDTQNMSIVEDFIDDVLKNAESQVEKQQQTQPEQSKENKAGKEKRASFNIPDFKNGKVVNRARGLVVRLFDAICNCANNAAAPAARMKLRGKRAATLNGTSSTNPTEVDGTEDKPETKKDAKDRFKKEKSDDHLEQRNANKGE